MAILLGTSARWPLQIALRRNNTLECLKLHGNNITELGVMAFGSALVTDNHTITILWLGQQVAKVDSNWTTAL